MPQKNTFIVCVIYFMTKLIIYKINYLLIIYISMGKKINENALTIRRLKSKGVNQAEIVRLLGVIRQKVSYWVNKEVTNSKKKN